MGKGVTSPAPPPPREPRTLCGRTRRPKLRRPSVLCSDSCPCPFLPSASLRIFRVPYSTEWPTCPASCAGRR